MCPGYSTVVRQSSTSAQLWQDRIDLVRYTCYVGSFPERWLQHPRRLYSCRSSGQHTHPGRSTNNLDMRKHISRIASTCFFHLRRLRQMRKILSRKHRQLLVSAVILSRLLQRHPRWTAGRVVAMSYECHCPFRRQYWTMRPRLTDNTRTPLATNLAMHRLQAWNNDARDRSWHCTGIHVQQGHASYRPVRPQSLMIWCAWTVSCATSRITSFLSCWSDCLEWSTTNHQEHYLCRQFQKAIKNIYVFHLINNFWVKFETLSN